MATARKSAPRSTRSGKRTTSSRKRITPSKDARGLDAEQIALALDSAEIAPLAAAVSEAGGQAIGGYREPLTGQPLLLASIPVRSVQPTPFQRDLSPTHAKRLAEKIEETSAFLDPLIVVRGEDGQLWTPNGRHRLKAAQILGLKQVTALISPDEHLAFRILALNTEKAHNLKDRSLEVVRMARALAERSPRTAESSFAAEFEAAELITLGLVYLQNGRFAGGAYRPFLKKVDRFSDRGLKASLREREGYASKLLAIDELVVEIIARLQERGFKSPYLRTYVVARINPVRFHRAKKGSDEPPMALAAGLTRMAASARKFDVASVKSSDLALVAAVSSGES